MNWQDLDGADTILRVSGGKEFKVRKDILSAASPVLKRMLSTSHPPLDLSRTPVVDVDDSPELLDAFLQSIYPVSGIPTFPDAEALVSFLRLVHKYRAPCALDIVAYYLPLTGDMLPLQRYAIFCACGQEATAEDLARNAPLTSIDHLDPVCDLLTAAQHRRLVHFMVGREQRMREIVSRHREGISGADFGPCGDAAHRLYFDMAIDDVQAAFEADPCFQLDGLEFAPKESIPVSPCTYPCKFNRIGIRKYAETLLGELVDMAKTHPWE